MVDKKEILENIFNYNSHYMIIFRKEFIKGKSINFIVIYNYLIRMIKDMRFLQTNNKL